MVLAEKVLTLLGIKKIPFIFYLSRDDGIFNDIASN
jgi:hypothetical protein